MYRGTAFMVIVWITASSLVWPDPVAARVSDGRTAGDPFWVVRCDTSVAPTAIARRWVRSRVLHQQAGTGGAPGVNVSRVVHEMQQEEVLVALLPEEERQPGMGPRDIATGDDRDASLGRQPRSAATASSSRSMSNRNVA